MYKHFTIMTLSYINFESCDKYYTYILVCGTICILFFKPSPLLVVVHLYYSFLTRAGHRNNIRIMAAIIVQSPLNRWKSAIEHNMQTCAHNESISFCITWLS